MQVNGAKEDTKVLFMSDTKTFFSKNYGWSAGMGDRNGRWVMVIERDGTVSVADVEENGRQVTVSLHPSRPISTRHLPHLHRRRHGEG